MQTKFFDVGGKRIHFVGINGVGVNALAKYCFDNGAIVSGSDRRLGNLCDELQKEGCNICEGENLNALGAADIVVYTSAISNDNVELSFAKSKGIPCFERHEFLNLIAKNFEIVVGVAGSHGKTTATAMISHILKEANKNFVAMIGGEAIKFSNYVNNNGEDGDIFVTEACEFRRHMLSLEPNIAVVLNTDWDHPDSYKDRVSVEEAFAIYLQKAKTKVFCGQNKEVVLETENETFKFEYDSKKNVYVDGALVGGFGNLQGEYNLKNALFAVATSFALGVKPKDSLRALVTFEGVKRRFEKVGEIFGVPVVFDFAHHPTEIKNLLERAKEYGRLLVVFQPHTYSRTKAYMDDFANVFTDFKNHIGTLILLETYAAREPQDNTCDSDALMKKILSKNAEYDVYLAKNKLSSVEFVKMLAKQFDLILFVGAGDIYDLKGYFQL